jgi:hypothetical protein
LELNAIIGVRLQVIAINCLLRLPHIKHLRASPQKAKTGLN